MPIIKGKLMFFDEVAWDKSDAQLATWKTTLLNAESLKKITTLTKTHRQGVSNHLSPPQKGSFNMVIRLRFTDGASAIIRFPIPGYSIFPDEKLQHEVSVMRFLERHTGIRIPHVLYHGSWARIDSRFFGEGSLEDQTELLTIEERDSMEAFVRRKLAEKEGGLVS
ncbi:hypothetical protein N7530_012084 [Penicillium desertorum]|uniref:Aminoglycoside phosphotransferase domain-containing protein n=1 Tax=Penicillium desertorum TaxID=1303715 RepID=A0A9X0BGA0_9EURO|nr:hypothetical protein N7530_012084 [Penicillium desertorum]